MSLRINEQHSGIVRNNKNLMVNSSVKACRRWRLEKG